MHSQKFVSAWQAAMKKSAEGEYTFRTPKFQPHNPANQPDPMEARALEAFQQGVTDLAGEIATASNEQAEGIDQINIGISQIDQVTQQNTATAEESAAAAEDLSGQAVRLHTMLSRFKLENARPLAPPPTATPAQRPSSSPEKSAAPQKRKTAKKEEWGTSGTSSSPPEMIALDDDEFGRY